MEKLMYLVWLDRDATRAEVADVMLGPWRASCCPSTPCA